MNSSRQHSAFRCAQSTTIIVLQVLAVLCLAVVSSYTVYAQSTFSAERLTNAARTYVQHKAGTDKVELKGSIADQTFAQSGVQARIKESDLASGELQNVVVEFVHSDKVIRQLSIPFRVERTVSVPVAVASLPAGTQIAREHIITEERPMASVRMRNLVPADSIVGKKLKVRIEVGEPLTAEKLTQADGIRRGQTVTLVVRSGPIVVTTQARALGDALPGETVTVVRNGATASIRAVAVGNGIVETTP